MTTNTMNEGQKTIQAILELEDLVEQLRADRDLDDAAFWLHIDRDLLDQVNTMLEKMTRAIEDEREGTSSQPSGLFYLGGES
jgi:hypothetical protein